MDVKELVTYMRENRVSRVKMGGLEVELDPSAFASPAAPEVKPEIPIDFTFYSVADQSPLAQYDSVVPSPEETP